MRVITFIAAPGLLDAGHTHDALLTIALVVVAVLAVALVTSMHATHDIRRHADATVARLPEYLRALHNLAGSGHDTVSSEALASVAGVVLSRPRKHPWIPRVAGLACYLIGVLDIISALFPRVRRMGPLHRLGHYVPGVQVPVNQINPYPVAASLIVGVLLVSLAHALRRRKHRAWMGVVALLGASIAVHLIRKETFGGVVLSLVLLVLLIVYRAEFYALSDPRSRWRAILAAGARSPMPAGSWASRSPACAT